MPGPADVEMLKSSHTSESLCWIGRCDQLPGSQGVAAREATGCQLIPGGQQVMMMAEGQTVRNVISGSPDREIDSIRALIGGVCRV
jgi:hypothetical protein